MNLLYLFFLTHEFITNLYNKADRMHHVFTSFHNNKTAVRMGSQVFTTTNRTLGFTSFPTASSQVFLATKRPYAWVPRSSQRRRTGRMSVFTSFHIGPHCRSPQVLTTSEERAWKHTSRQASSTLHIKSHHITSWHVTSRQPIWNDQPSSCATVRLQSQRQPCAVLSPYHGPPSQLPPSFPHIVFKQTHILKAG